MNPKRRNNRDNSPWSSKRSRSRSYSPARRYHRSPRNLNRKRSRFRDQYSKRDQTSNNYRNEYIPNNEDTSTRILPPPPPPAVHSIPTPSYNPAPESDYKKYVGYIQQNSMQPDYGQTGMISQFNVPYPPPPTWNTPTAETHVMAAPPPSPIAPPISAPIHKMQPPIPTTIQPPPTCKEKVKAVVAQEIQNQQEELKKQRNNYLKKSDTMKKELKKLKKQMVDLIGLGDAPPSPTAKCYIDENEKLQGEIQKKINKIENFLDMLNGIIGTDEKREPTPSNSASSSYSSNTDYSPPERLKTKVIESMKSRKETQNILEKKKSKRQNNSIPEGKFNFVFYDPKMNWCQICNIFPKSAKDLLNHMHSKEHTDKVDVLPTPWHDDFRSDEFPNVEYGQTKRVPIRGLQFLVPARAWFCKLCKVWMGDLHCASSHLKSRTHSYKYDELFQKNLTYEVEWMTERQKTMDKIGKIIPPGNIKNENLFDNIPLKIEDVKGTEGKHGKAKKHDSKKKKNKTKHSKKNKKASSSSTSNSSSSESDSGGVTKENRGASIPVVMRNLKKEDIKDDLTKGGYNPMQTNEREKNKDDRMITQWNTPQPIISESEKKLLEQLKGKLKNKSQDEPIKKENESKKPLKRDHIRKRSPVTKERSPVTRNRTNRSRNRDRFREKRSRSRNRDRFREKPSRRRNGNRNRSPCHWRNKSRSTSRKGRKRWSTTKSRSRSLFKREGNIKKI